MQMNRKAKLWGAFLIVTIVASLLPESGTTFVWAFFAGVLIRMYETAADQRVQKDQNNHE